MPDFFSNNNTAQQIPQSGDFRTSTVPVIQPVDDTHGDNWISRAISSVQRDPNIIAQRYSNPVITRPVTDENEQFGYYSGEIGYSLTDPNEEQRYAKRQGMLDSFKNRLVKTGANALTGLISGFTGTIDFLAGKGSEGIASNQTLNSLSKFTEDLNKSLPNFRSQYDIDHPLFNTHMIGDTFESAGFTIGAVGSALAIDALLTPLTEGIGGAILLPKQLASITSKWGKLSSVIAEGGTEYKALMSSIQEAGDVTNGVNKALKNFNTFTKIKNLTEFGVNTAVSAVGEAAIEGNQALREVRKNLMSQYSNQYGDYTGDKETLNRIENTAKQAGADVVLPNFIFLALSNGIGLQSILRPSQAAIKATEEALGKRVGVSVVDANTVSATKIPYDQGFKGLMQRLAQPSNIIKDNIREAVEEGYQYVVSDASKNYYQRKFNAKSNNDNTSMYEDYLNSIGRAFSTEEGLQSMIMGFGGGALQGGIKHIVNRARGIKEGQALATVIQNNLNNYTTTSIFNSPRTEAVVSTNILKEMEEAAATGDVLKYKNLQLEALFNWVNSAVKNNRYETRLQQLEALKGLDPESFQTMWGVDLNDTSKKTVDNFIDSVAVKANNIKEKIESVENAFGRNSFDPRISPIKYAAFENYKQELAISMSQVEDYKKRIENIKNEIAQKVPAVNIDHVVELSSLEGINRTIDRFSNRIEELKNSEELSSGNKPLLNTFKDEREFLERRVGELKWATQDNNRYTPDFLGTVNSIHNYYGNGNSPKGSFSIPELDSYNILKNSKDVHSLLEDTSRISNYYRELAGKEGFANFERKYTKDVGDYMDNLYITPEGKVRVKEPETVKTAEEVKSTVENDIKEALDNVGVDNLEELKKEVEEGNVVFSGKGLKRRDPNNPKTTEEEIEELRMMTEYWDNAVSGREYLATEREEDGSLVNPQWYEELMNEDITQKAKVLDEEGKVVAPENKKDKTESTIDDVIDHIITVADKTWKNATFKFYNFFNKINSWKDTRTNEDYSGNLLNTLLNNSEVDVLNGITLKLEPAPKSSRKASKVPLFVKQEDGSYKKQFTDLKSNNYKHNVEVWFKSKKIGILQEPERLGFENEDGDFVTLGSITSPELYSELTLNSPDTFETFKQQYNDYKQAYDAIVSQQGKKKTFSNKDINTLFTPLITYGRIATTKNQDFSIKVSDLKLWKGSGIIEVSKDGGINILNSKELSDTEIADLIAYVGKDGVIKQLLSSGRDYFVISKLPDGSFRDKMSVIYARAVETNVDPTAALDLFYNKEGLDGIKINIPSKQHGTTKLTFSPEEDGDVKMTLKNGKRSASQEFILSSEDIAVAESIDDIVDLINKNLQTVKNPLLSRLNMQVRKEDIKQSGINSNSSLSAIKENLKAAVSTPEIYTGFAINFYPASQTELITEDTEQEESGDVVSEEEYNNFVDNNVVTEDRINSIANKVINREKLSPNETAIFAGKTKEINEKIKEIAESNEGIEERIVNENLNSILSQLESVGFLTKTCD